MHVRAVIEGVPVGIEIVVGTCQTGVQRSFSLRLYSVDSTVVVCIFPVEDLLSAAEYLKAVHKHVFAAGQVRIKICQNSFIEPDTCGASLPPEQRNILVKVPQ